MKIQFDKVYVLSLITNKDRQEFMKYQLNELGIDFEFVYGIDFYKFDNLVCPDVYKDIPYPYDGYYNNEIIRLKCYSVTLVHYMAVMQAYHLGYNNVLIMEDDAVFRNDKQLFSKFFNNIPEDADFVTYDIRDLNKHIEDDYIYLINENKDKLYFYDVYNYRFFGGALYGIMNRNAMKLYLDNQHKKIVMSDWVKDFWNFPTVKRYIPTECLCVSNEFYKRIFIDDDDSYNISFDNLFYRRKPVPQKCFFKPNSIQISSITENR